MASSKIGRNYRLLIQNYPKVTPALAGGTTSSTEVGNTAQNETTQTAIQIDFPFTIDFDIHRFIGSANNEMNLRIFNLAEKTRFLIVKDPFNNQWVNTGGHYNQIQLQAGYGKNLSMIFVGEVLDAYSERVGPDVITHVRAVTGAYGRYNTYINQTFAENTTNQEIVNSIIQELVLRGDMQRGAIKPIDGVAVTGFVGGGDAFNILSQFGPVFVDLNQINILQLDQVIGAIGGAKNVLLLNADSGLLGTPLRRQTMIEVKLIFEPLVKLGQLVEIQSTTDKRFNGQYKVMGIEHKGIISGSMNGPLTTTLQLYLGNKALQAYVNIPAA